MPIQASITLDSGSFLAPDPSLGYPNCRVGYFQCDPSCPDIRLYANGEEIDVKPRLKLGDGNSKIDIMHVHPDGKHEGGVIKSQAIDEHLLIRGDLYKGEAQAPAVEEGNLDCILQFHSGHFRPSMVKQRTFKEILRDGTLGTRRKADLKPIAHDVVAYYDLADGDELKLVKNGQTLWTSKSLGNLQGRFDLEILADNGTAVKYYRDTLKSRASYWLPNQGDPPPMMGPP